MTELKKEPTDSSRDRPGGARGFWVVGEDARRVAAGYARFEESREVGPLLELCRSVAKEKCRAAALHHHEDPDQVLRQVESLLGETAIKLLDRPCRNDSQRVGRFCSIVRHSLAKIFFDGRKGPKLKPLLDDPRDQASEADPDWMEEEHLAYALSVIRICEQNALEASERIVYRMRRRFPAITFKEIGPRIEKSGERARQLFELAVEKLLKCARHRGVEL